MSLYSPPQKNSYVMSCSCCKHCQCCHVHTYDSSFLKNGHWIYYGWQEGALIINTILRLHNQVCKHVLVGIKAKKTHIDSGNRPDLNLDLLKQTCFFQRRENAEVLSHSHHPWTDICVTHDGADCAGILNVMSWVTPLKRITSPTTDTKKKKHFQFFIFHFKKIFQI